MTTDPQKSVHVSPVTISIVGTGTGDGGGVAPTPNGTEAKTPSGQPNLLINVITPAVAVLVRFVSQYLTTFVGFLTAAGIGEATGINAQVFAEVDFGTLVRGFAWTSLVIAGVGGLKNIATIFLRLEGRYPLATGSI